MSRRGSGGLAEWAVTGVASGAVLAVAGALHAALNARLLHAPAASPATVGERVSVLVPARDEAHQIGDCLRLVLASTGLADLEVLVLDDDSADGTAGVVERLATAEPRLRLLHGAGDPPTGWLGKPWACHRLAAAASGTVLVFLDADVRLAPGGLAAGVGLLRSRRLDLVSPYPRQLADGLGPRLVQPLLQWSWLTFLPLQLAERLPAATLTAANGQLLLMDAAAHHRCGGHAAVAGEVVEDVALARAAKRAGGRVALADGTSIATCRMYEGWDGLREGYTKSLWSAFGQGQAGVVVVALLLSLAYLVPPLGMLVGCGRILLGWRAGSAGRGCPGGPAAGVSGAVGGRLAAWGALGTGGGIAGRVLAARRTGGRPRDALAHPLSIAVLLWLIGRSRQARRRGTLVWKGRHLAVGARG